MFQAVEKTEARTVWVETPISELGMGFLESTRIEITRGGDASDWSEPGTPYTSNLLAGLWPEDWELALMALGYSPGSDEARDFLFDLVSDQHPESDEDWLIDEAKTRLLKGIDIMPTWGGASTRAMFVRAAFVRGTGQDGSAVVAPTGGAQQPDVMAFDMWRLLLDKELNKLGVNYGGITDEEVQDEHSRGVEPAALAERISQRAESTQPVDAGEDAD
jgi:hypothetical protein